MDVPLYDVYLTGKLAASVTREQAGARLAQIFKTSPDTMLAMLTGKAHLLKRGVDKNTALKYREALQQAGVEVAFKAQTIAPESSAAKNIAPVADTAAASAPAQPLAAAAGLSLAPVGADVLKADERSQVVAATVDLSHLAVAELGPLTDASQRAPAATAPAVDHLSLAAAGSDLLTAEERERAPVAPPDIGEFTLAPAGSPLETLADQRTPVQVDTSGLTIAPSGADLLTPEQRRKVEGAAPNTDHIKLA